MFKKANGQNGFVLLAVIIISSIVIVLGGLSIFAALNTNPDNISVSYTELQERLQNSTFLENAEQYLDTDDYEIELPYVDNDQRIKVTCYNEDNPSKTVFTYMNA